MRVEDDDRSVEQFEARLQSWGGRPPSLAPAVAAGRIVGRIADERAAVPWLRLAAVTAMLVAIAVGVWRTTPHRAPVAALVATGSSSGDVVQFWLDPDTPVYFVLQPFGTEKGESS